MYRLRGSDAQHIYNETPNSPFETLKVTVYEPLEGEAIDVAELTEFLKSAVRNSPTQTMSMRVLRVPLDIHHPVWVKDPNYCLDDHYYHTALPAPGGKQQLCDFISTLLSRPLYSDRPLWETWIVEGLEGGRVAAVSKVHHVLADGLTSVKGLVRMHSQSSPETQPSEPEAEVPPLPSKLRLAANAVVELIRSFTVELPAYWRHIQKKRQASAALKAAEPNLCEPFQAPHTVLNELGGPHRYYHYDMFSLQDIRRLSKQFDCTINTFIMAVSAEAFRRYFIEIDQLPNEPLVAVMPVGLSSEGELKGLFNTEIQNNSLTFVLIPFDLHKTDFKERLAEIQRASKIGVDNVKKAEGHRLDNFFDYLPAVLIRFGNAVLSWRQRHRKNPMANIGISNVPGPREPMYACNGKYKVAELLSCGNLADLGNFSLTIWSYMDQMCFSYHYRKGPIPRHHRIHEHVADIINELLVNPEPSEP